MRSLEDREGELRAALEDERTLDHIAELADISREGVGQEPAARLVTQAPPPAAQLRLKLRQQGLGEGEHVLATRAQRGDFDLEDGQPEPEVLAEAPGLHLHLEI